MTPAQRNRRRLKNWVRVARHERKPVPLEREALARALDVTVEQVLHWESPSLLGSLPTQDQLRDIERLTNFSLPAGWDAIVSPRGARKRPASIDQGVAPNVADEIRAIARVLAADGFSSPSNARRNATVFSYRYGTGGAGVALTTRTLAVRAAISDALVRQILARLRRALVQRRKSLTSPRFDELAAALPRHIGSTMQRAERDLRRLLGHRLSIADAIRFGFEVLGRPPPIAFALRGRHVVLIGADA